MPDYFYEILYNCIINRIYFKLRVLRTTTFYLLAEVSGKLIEKLMTTSGEEIPLLKNKIPKATDKKKNASVEIKERENSIMKICDDAQWGKIEIMRPKIKKSTFFLSD